MPKGRRRAPRRHTGTAVRGVRVPARIARGGADLRSMLGECQTASLPSLPDMWRPSAFVEGDQRRSGTVRAVPSSSWLR
jgi:hypothetical protein